MSMINPKWSLENQANRLEKLQEEQQEWKNRNKKSAYLHKTKKLKWQRMDGDTPVGEPFDATQKEVMLLRVKADQDYLKKIAKWKGTGERPRLTIYNKRAFNFDKDAEA